MQRAAGLILILGSVLVRSVAVAAPPAALDGPLTTETDTAAMVDLETKINDSMQQGHVVEINFRTAEQIPGDVESTWSWGDSGEWTGVYAGGEAMRYAVAKTHLKEKGKAAGDRRFWKAQRDEALSRIETMLAAQHREINIAEDWQGSLKIPPDVNSDPIEKRHAANFGGGIIRGERGMLLRTCTPEGLGRLGINEPTVDEAEPVNNNSNRVYKITSHEDGITYNCETSPSRDTYAGVTFGLLLMFDLVGPDEPELRDQIRTDLVSMGNFLLKYGWNYPRPHGYVAAYPFQNDFDGFISPFMGHVPMARLNMTNAVRHVVNNGGSAADQQRWNAVWAEELVTQAPLLGLSMEIDNLENYEPYYKFNLHHLNAFNLLRTTTGADRELLALGFAVEDKTTRDDINAHFEAITYALTGEQWRLDAAVTHLREWLQYRARVETGELILNSPRCDLPPDDPEHLDCLPQDEYQVHTPAGPVSYRPGLPDADPVMQSPGRKAAGPLPVADRPPWDFLWQRGPTLLDGLGNGQPKSWRMPGIDFLTPYWMIRYFTEVAPPATQPFPEWVGFAH
jgi:hypothetical protein